MHECSTSHLLTHFVLDVLLPDQGAGGCTVKKTNSAMVIGIYEEGGFCPTCVAKMSTQKKMQDDKLFKKVLGMALDKYPVNNAKLQLSDDDENVSKKSS